MQLFKTVLLFMLAVTCLALTAICAISVFTLSIPQIDPQLKLSWKVGYTIGFLIFPTGLLLLTIYLFKIAKRSTKRV